MNSSVGWTASHALPWRKENTRAFGETCLSDFEVFSLILTFPVMGDLFKVRAEQLFGYDGNLEKLLWVRGGCKCTLDFSFQWRALFWRLNYMDLPTECCHLEPSHFYSLVVLPCFFNICKYFTNLGCFLLFNLQIKQQKALDRILLFSPKNPKHSGTIKTAAQPQPIVCLKWVLQTLFFLCKSAEFQLCSFSRKK